LFWVVSTEVLNELAVSLVVFSVSSFSFLQNAHIPEKLVDLLIEATEENVALEYESIMK